jgi:hypothetical protein
MQKQFTTEHWYKKVAGLRANLDGKWGRRRRI